MSSFVKNNLRLIAQGITGAQLWDYTDTGVNADITEVAGYIQKAGDHGMDTGAHIFIHTTNGGNTKVVYGGVMTVIQDTGSTQGTVGLTVLVGDTS